MQFAVIFVLLLRASKRSARNKLFFGIVQEKITFVEGKVKVWRRIIIWTVAGVSRKQTGRRTAGKDNYGYRPRKILDVAQ